MLAEILAVVVPIITAFISYLAARRQAKSEIEKVKWQYRSELEKIEKQHDSEIAKIKEETESELKKMQQKLENETKLYEETAITDLAKDMFKNPKIKHHLTEEIMKGFFNNKK